MENKHSLRLEDETHSFRLLSEDEQINIHLSSLKGRAKAEELRRLIRLGYNQSLNNNSNQNQEVEELKKQVKQLEETVTAKFETILSLLSNGVSIQSAEPVNNEVIEEDTIIDDMKIEDASGFLNAFNIEF